MKETTIYQIARDYPINMKYTGMKFHYEKWKFYFQIWLEIISVRIINIFIKEDNNEW